MYDTYLTIMGRVISEPRATQTSGGELLSFRVACNSRRLDRQSGEWTDGHTLFVAVSCWRRVAVNAQQILRRGSVIIAHGKVYTDEFVGSDGIKRSQLAMVAGNLGLDLSYSPSAGRAGEEPGGAPEAGADLSEPVAEPAWPDLLEADSSLPEPAAS